MQNIYHIAEKKDWEKALKTGQYRVSTLGKSLDDIGFIHFSFAHQVKMVADFIYNNIDELVLLRVSTDKLKSEIKVEPVSGTIEKFPHLYGPLNIDAVDSVEEYKPRLDGLFPDIKD